MLRVQLWKGTELLRQLQARDPGHADRLSDALLTEVHAGDHGEGDFDIGAEYVNDIGAFEAPHWKSPKISYPPRLPPSKAAARLKRRPAAAKERSRA